MLIYLNLEVYAVQSTVRCLDLHVSQANATVETLTMSDYNVLIFSDSLAQPFQFAFPIA